LTPLFSVGLSNNFEQWTNFLHEDSCGNIFQSGIMNKAYYENLKFKPFLIIATLDNQLIGGILTYRRSIPRFSWVNEFYTSYGPVVSENVPDITRIRIMEKLLNAVHPIASFGTTKHSFFAKFDSFVNQKNQNDFKSMFTSIGYKRVLNGYDQTYLVDLLLSQETILTNFEKRTRWALKKARKSNIKISKDNTTEGLRKFYVLYLNIARKHKSIATPFNFLKSLLDLLGPKGMFDIYIAYLDNLPVSASIILSDEKTAYYYMSANLENYDNLQASTYLQYSIIIDAKLKGLKEYDLLCAPSSKELSNSQFGLYLFKRGFGGKCIPIFHYEREFNQILCKFENIFFYMYKRLV
jgi:peptidoglycan pentaglycine glycine transferase (the first glycine)